MPHRAALVLAVSVAAVCAITCRRSEKPPAESSRPQIAWKRVGAWSGRGNRQTESFTSDSGALRVRWETKLTAAAPDGLFRLTAHSAISGRPLEQVVEQHGAGAGTGYVSQDPHVFYMSVESSGLDWTFSVEEGIALSYERIPSTGSQFEERVTWLPPNWSVRTTRRRISSPK